VLGIVHPDATVFGAVPVAMMTTINITARTEGREKKGQWPSLQFFPNGEEGFAVAYI
jgi:hypothetical protein